jgi:mannosyltransferase
VTSYVAATPLPAVRAFAARHALLLIVALAALLRFATLGIPAFWLDESLTATETRDGFLTMLSAVRDVEVHPPLYYVLAWGWQKSFGSSELALRSLSALLGTATVPAVYAAARALASRRAGLVAAALAATNPLLIWYSQEARPYPLLILLSALSFLFFVHSLNSPDPRWLGAWTLTSALGLATHYFAVAVVVPEAIWLLVASRASRRHATLAVTGVAAAGLALLPLWAAQQDHDVAPGWWIPVLHLSDRLVALPQHFVVGLSVPWKALPALIGGGLVVLVAYAMTKADGRSRRAFAVAAGVGLAGMLLALFGVLVGRDYLITRNLLELWVPLAVAVAIVLGTRAVGRIGPAAVTVLCLAGIVLSVWNALTPAARRLDWDEVAQALGEPGAERVIGVPGQLAGAPLSLQLDGAHVAKPGERIVASDLVLLSLRQVPNYGVGPCWWGAVCGGNAYGGSGPSLRAPAPFRLVDQGSTPRITYRIYRAKRPVRIPAPTTRYQSDIVVQAPR